MTAEVRDLSTVAQLYEAMSEIAGPNQQAFKLNRTIGPIKLPPGVQSQIPKSLKQLGPVADCSALYKICALAGNSGDTWADTLLEVLAIQLPESFQTEVNKKLSA